MDVSEFVASENPSAMKRDIEVIRCFMNQFSAISEGAVLDLLESFEGKPFMNAEARRIFGSRRQTAWLKLSRLSEAGLVVKRGHVYRVTPFTAEFVKDAANVLRRLMLGGEAPPAVDKDVLRVALEGVEALFSKGKLTQEDYFRCRKSLEGMGVGV